MTEQSSHMAKTRVVDTRAGSVDLSRYDEKLETFVDTDRKGFSSEKQKLKKQNTGKGGQRGGQKGGMSRSEKERMAMDKLRRKQEMEKKKKQLEITVPEEISVGELASRLKVTAAVVVKKLMNLGVMASVNQLVDYDTAYLVADELGAKGEKRGGRYHRG